MEARDNGRVRTLFNSRAYGTLGRTEIRWEIDNALREIDPDAVAINGWSVPEALAAVTWCQKNRRTAILMAETHRPSGNWLKEFLKRRRVRRFDGAIVGGRWHAVYLEGLGFDPGRIHVGYDAVDNEHFARGADAARFEDARIREHLRLPARYFFANTRFLPRKNIDGLLHAYNRYRNEQRSAEGPWHLVVSGSGEMEGSWKALAGHLGLADIVHWPGFVQYPELPAYYGLAGAFVHVAREEAWGLVVNEAAAAGLPLIVGKRVGAACELVQDGENGFLVDAEDHAGIAEAMAAIASVGQGSRDQFGHCSFQLVAPFGVERFGSALSAVLAETIKFPEGCPPLRARFAKLD